MQARVCVCAAAVGAQKHFAEDAMGSHRESATVMPITTLEARLVARDVEGGLCGFVWGSWSARGGEGSAEGICLVCSHYTG